MPPPKIVRSSRKTISLIIQADGSLEVRAPLRATNRLIAELVEQKAEWIRTRRVEVLSRPKPEPHQFVSGESFLYLGRICPLQVKESSHSRLEYANGKFTLSVQPVVLQKNANSWKTIVRAVFTEWYRRQARQVMEERVAFQAQRFGFTYRQVKITSAATRWGSCSSRGTLSFPWRLVMAPLAVIDYVVVHELIHTVVNGHGAGFWSRVQALNPGYQQSKTWLKENGALLVL